MKSVKLSLAILNLFIFTVFHFETLAASESSAEVDVEVVAEVKMNQDQIKESLKKSSVENRLEAISRAEVMNEKIDRVHRENPAQISQIDMTEELKQICGSSFNYSNNDRKEYVSWPTVNCKYKQDNSTLSGGTKKFNCDFNEVSKNEQNVIKKRKVKYSTFFGLYSSELVPTILASTIARMIGFYTEAYCPAKIKCENCPTSDPWDDSKRSSAPGTDKTYTFDYAIVERPANLMTITPASDRPANSYPHGLFWNEILSIKATDNKSIRDKAIEREAWLLWINFLADTDAFNFNQRISCAKARQNGAEAKCDKPVIYTHDYGHAFNYRFKFEKWKTRPPIIQNQDGTCKGGLTAKLMEEERNSKNNTDLNISPQISSEARDFLVSRMRNISEKQWRDIFRISNAERLFRVSADDWVKTIREKIDVMGQAQCAPFSSRTSVISSKVSE